MKGMTHRGAGGGVAILAAFALNACATEGYVDTAVYGVQTQVTANTGRINQHDQRLGRLDGQVSAAQARADAAYKLAEGRFTTARLGDETLNFDTGRFMLTQAHQAQLSALAERLKAENRDVYLEIEGFADSQGQERANRWLSVRRAYAVYNFLRDQGIGLNRMQMIGLGEEHPLAGNETPEGREQNRRVVITIVG